jgi:citrate lyase gamma subunit
MDTDTDVETMESVSESMDYMSISNESDVELLDDFESAIKEFTQIEETHTAILKKLNSLSANLSVVDVSALKKMHQEAMDHIRATGKSNFGALIGK